MITELVKDTVFRVKIRSVYYRVKIEQKTSWSRQRYYKIIPITLKYYWKFWEKYGIYNTNIVARMVMPDEIILELSSCYATAFKSRSAAIKFLYYIDRTKNPNFYSNHKVFYDYLNWVILLLSLVYLNKVKFVYKYIWKYIY